MPSGILNKNAQCVVGNGVVIHLPSLFEEIATLKSQGVSTEGRLVVSERAHLLFDLHKVGGGFGEGLFTKVCLVVSERAHLLFNLHEVGGGFWGGLFHRGLPGRVEARASALRPARGGARAGAVVQRLPVVPAVDARCGASYG